jgi:hypothetical protein
LLNWSKGFWRLQLDFVWCLFIVFCYDSWGFFLNFRVLLFGFGFCLELVCCCLLCFFSYPVFIFNFGSMGTACKWICLQPTFSGFFAYIQHW